MIDREVIVCSRDDCADASFRLFEPALPLGVDEPPAVFDEFAPSVALGERDGELGSKLFVNRFVVADSCVSALVWLASGVDERMDRGGHPAGHRPVARAGFPRGLATRTARVVTMRTLKMAADG
jgi:hypothetical protein